MWCARVVNTISGASLDRFAIRRSFGETVSGLDLPIVVLPSDSIGPVPAFPPLGPSGRFPSFTGTIGHSDFLPPIPSHFVSFV